MTEERRDWTLIVGFLSIAAVVLVLSVMLD